MNALLWRLEWALFNRDRANRWVVLSAFIFAVLAICLGHLQLQADHAAQKRVFAASQADLQAKRAQTSVPGLDAGDFAYYQFYPVYTPLSAWRALSQVGHSSETAIKRIRMLGLQGQIYDGAFQNPEPLAIGRFDYAFIVIAFLPLALIALLFNLRAQDEQTQRGNLLQVYAQSPMRLYLARAVLRFVALLIALLLPLALYAQWQGLPKLELLRLLTAIVVYGVVWLLIILALLAWLHRRGQNAKAFMVAGRLLLIWLLLVFIAPQWISAMTSQGLQADLGPQIALTHRKSVADAWDVPKAVRFQRFFEEHPEWRNTAPVTVRFHWKWYYAFHHVADMDVRKQVQGLHTQMRIEQQRRDRFGALIFPIKMQALFDQLTAQRAQQRIAHAQCIEAWHTRLRVYFYPFVFNEQLLAGVDVDKIPRFDASRCVLPP
jgi:ABC-2 type transport system permease protein